VTNFGTVVAYCVSIMEYKRRYNSRRWFQNIVKFMVFGLFTANAKAQVLFGPPSITVPPVGISVQNGGTAVLTMASTSTPLTISSVTWYYNNKVITNANATVLTVNLGLTASSTLTINNFNASAAGNYYVKVANSAGTTTSSNATLIVVGNIVSNVVSVVSSATGMVKDGFKLEFSAPTGSNIVIQATSDLSNWSAISTNLASDGTVTYTDTVAKTISCRFYRAKVQ
jgi:hypothetical protein